MIKLSLLLRCLSLPVATITVTAPPPPHLPPWYYFHLHPPCATVTSIIIVFMSLYHNHHNCGIYTSLFPIIPRPMQIYPHATTKMLMLPMPLLTSQFPPPTTATFFTILIFHFRSTLPISIHLYCC